MKSKLRDRTDPTFALLCVLAREELARDPAIHETEWKERVKAKAVDLGHRCPQSGRVYHAIDAVLHTHRRLRVRPSSDPPSRTTETRDPPDPFPELPARPSTGFVPVATMS